MGNDTFTRDRLDWLDQVLADFDLSPLAFKVAFLVSRYVHRERLYAWLSQGKLAKAVGASRRGVQKALYELEERGHLAVDGQKDRGETNHYRWILKDAAILVEGVDVAPEEIDQGANHSAHPPAHRDSYPCEPECAQDSLNNSLKKPSETQMLLLPGFDPEKEERKKRLSEEELAEAFEARFWKHAIRKRSKPAAFKAWKRIVQSGEATIEDLETSFIRHNHEERARIRTGGLKKWTPHPSSWLNKTGGLDEPDDEEIPEGDFLEGIPTEDPNVTIITPDMVPATRPRQSSPSAHPWLAFAANKGWAHD
ncbi:helix-turn-helix domain-containing protein [Microvirga sp. HBU67558]|uniref:helix-turn-helix domain-containing protein n=1 Tax=Microvirga TaxID=186650 RepID=UPI001B395971|nr:MULTISPECIES: helix-turn-helix domain-containing protein [unclassified Microvirga]MBQ0822113.1 helix-turn-helix domain-containing protein [Microvirga sp. HBU67558]